MPEERPLSPDEVTELQDVAEALGLTSRADLDELLEAVRDGLVPADDDLAFALGSWLGATIKDLTGWRWVYLQFGTALEGAALVARDRSVALLPHHLVAAALESETTERLQVLLDRLAQGERPRGEPRSYALIE